MDRGAWLATVHGVAESWTRLKWLSTHVHVTYITHPFSYCFPLWFIVGYWIRFPVLYSRTLLFIHSRYNSLHLLIQNSQSISPPCPLHPGNHKSVGWFFIAYFGWDSFYFSFKFSGTFGVYIFLQHFILNCHSWILPEVELVRCIYHNMLWLFLHLLLFLPWKWQRQKAWLLSCSMAP